ncbi:hypothetical protein [Flavobacterium sp. HJJ]|uniref:hypothetical protein n=1 Tax=Flavobacterium sp. HJJ TaxID=2783792 RepID=UPI00188DBFF1|nr:hypothetical protein [Flavobacterium sp. HJJ]MBF4469903.1 hypothetical protein [Flavobacterium sp. HJJ]
MSKKSNFKEWFDRYKYSELAATSTALTASLFSKIFNAVTTAYLITFAEYSAFYSVMIYRLYKTKITENKAKNKKITFMEILILIWNLFLEFGYPAILDFFFIRPFCMYWMPTITGNYFTGTILGKITADCIFYSLTIINYEFIKRKS